MRDDKPRNGLIRLCHRAAELATDMLDLGYTEAQVGVVVRLYTLSCTTPRTTPPDPYPYPDPAPEPWPDADD